MWRGARGVGWGAGAALLAAGLLALATAGCDRGLKPPAATSVSAAAGAGAAGAGPLAGTGPMVVFQVPGAPVRVAVELASTPAARAKGLMDRTSLAPDAGMLFVFEREAVQGFWMKDTFIALDMIFIDGARRVVGVLRDVPPRTEASRSVGKPSRFVLEVNAGFAAREGIVEGTMVELVNVPGS